MTLERIINTIIQGDALTVLKDMPDKIIQTVVTSPPYWGLRDYGTAEWEGGDKNCDHVQIKTGMSNKNTLGPDKYLPPTNAANIGKKLQYKNTCGKCGAVRIDSQLGLERTPEEYVEKMVEIFREVRRVLRDDGTLWLNMGDSYWGGKGQSSQAWSTENQDRDTLQKSQHQICGKGETRPSDGKHDTLKPKDLCGIPWRVAFALQADGWYLRSDIIWSKPNPMPESCTDRPTKAHEYVFLLTKKAKYYYDADAVREPIALSTIGRGPVDFGGEKGRNYKPEKGDPNYRGGNEQWGRTYDYTQSNADGGRNRRTVWEIPTQPFDGEYCTNCDTYYTGSGKNRISTIKVIEDGEEKTKRVCPVCKSTENWIGHFATFPEKLVEPCILAGSAEKACGVCGAAWERVVNSEYEWLREKRENRSFAKTTCYMGKGIANKKIQTLGFRPTCEHDNSDSRCIVLDPFMGSGTVAKVALRANRNFIGIELNGDYIKMAEKRIVGLLAQEVLL